MGRRKLRDDKLREEMGIYEGLMDDFAALANIFIGNDVMDDYNEAGDYQPLLRLISELQFDPSNNRLYTEVNYRIKLIEKKLLKLRGQIDSNYKKAKFIYRSE